MVPISPTSSSEEDTSADISLIRARILSSLKGSIHDSSIRFLEDTATMKKFLYKAGSDVEEAVSLLRQAIVWREVVNIEEVVEAQRNRRSPLMLLHKVDFNNQPVLYIHLRHLLSETRDFEGFKRLCIGKLEAIRLLSSSSPTGKCLVVCDVAGLSVASFNFQLLSFITETCSKYFPDTFDRVLVVNMSELYQAIWEMCKSVLQEDTLKQVAFITKAGLQAFIAPGNLLPAFLVAKKSEQSPTTHFLMSTSTETKDETSPPASNGFTPPPQLKGHSSGEPSDPPENDDVFFDAQSTIPPPAKEEIKVEARARLPLFSPLNDVSYRMAAARLQTRLCKEKVATAAVRLKNIDESLRQCEHAAFNIREDHIQRTAINKRFSQLVTLLVSLLTLGFTIKAIRWQFGRK